MKLIISKPCSANWEQMTSCMKGRHCQSCDKTVVDFTQMNKIQIDSYILQNKGQEVCGRFNKTQLIKHSQKLQPILVYLYKKTNNELKAYLPKLVIMFILSLIITISGCESETKKDTENLEGNLPIIQRSHFEMGKVSAIESKDIKNLE